MARPFYTAPSPHAIRKEVKHITDCQKKRWSGNAFAVIKNLDEYRNVSNKEIARNHVSTAKVQHALALEYGASDWNDLIFLAESMEHDDFKQISNRAKFLVSDHAEKHRVAAERLRKALPKFRRRSDAHIFRSPITLADAQRVIAKEYGFDAWTKLRKFVTSHPSTEGFLNTPGALPPAVAAIVEAVDAADVESVKKLIEQNPSLVHARVASDITCGDTLLHRADPRATRGAMMKQGHMLIAQQLIDNGIDINAMGGCGDSCFTSPLDASVWINNRRMVDLLLKNGADPNCSYWTMTKPVRTAANHNGRDSFRKLVKAGATYTLYETVELGFLSLTRKLLEQDAGTLHEAVEATLPVVQAAKDPKMMRLLLRHGADPNSRDERGITPLMAATQFANNEVIEMLIAQGAKKDIFFAIGSRDRGTVAQMLKEDPNCHKSQHVTPLIWAVMSGDLPIVESLLKSGANANESQQKWMQDTPLVAAVAHSLDHLVPVLLKHGADVNPARSFKWSIPLTAAVRWGSYGGVRMLLEAGADPNVVSDDGVIGNPLGWVGYVGDLISASMLVGAGTVREARSHSLASAAHHGKLEIIELLGTLDTDLMHSHERGNPLQLAKRNKHAKALELLNELIEIHGLPKPKKNNLLGPRAEFLHFLCNDEGKSLDKLIAKKPKLVDRDLVHNELFHHATGNLQIKIDKQPLESVVNVLLKHGVPWTLQSAVACNRIKEVRRLSKTPGALNLGVHTAAKFNNLKALKFFLDVGANVNARERWGTAAHEAVRYRSVEALECLIERGANIKATDQYGSKPHDFFLDRGNESDRVMLGLLDSST
ncbi:MAG: ankyrin repeat domain-containing protein [Gammaproteobacteria bacterium]|nr:ankyrin repeat domain-containing protein [Gammaproteobacteria bacterium]